jgi:hypothetical protein
MIAVQGLQKWRGDRHVLRGVSFQVPEGTVLDGELVGWANDAPLPFARLQRRINRLRPGPKLLADCPVRFVAYDLLRLEDRDLRASPLADRRASLERLLAGAPAALGISPRLRAARWDALAALRAEARARGVEGLMLKRLDSAYRGGRHRVARGIEVGQVAQRPAEGVAQLAVRLGEAGAQRVLLVGDDRSSLRQCDEIAADSTSQIEKNAWRCSFIHLSRAMFGRLLSGGLLKRLGDEEHPVGVPEFLRCAPPQANLSHQLGGDRRRIGASQST